ncbi:MAG TPA: hypothetical protein DEQ61_04260 [Streptomyces sp.]|nr:hypothetical protein [Streptomyces sp.]
MLRPREGKRRNQRRRKRVRTAAITPERQPLATLSRNLLDRPCPESRNPPVQGRSHPDFDLLDGDPSDPRRRLDAVTAGMDRAWPIVVHSRPRHKGFITCE